MKPSNDIKKWTITRRYDPDYDSQRTDLNKHEQVALMELGQLLVSIHKRLITEGKLPNQPLENVTRRKTKPTRPSKTNREREV